MLSEKKEFESNCYLAKSSKISERKKACEKLLDTLNDQKIVDYLNSIKYKWSDVFPYIKTHFLKEAERSYENSIKKGEPFKSDQFTPPLLLQFCRIATRDKACSDVKKIFNEILELLDINYIRLHCSSIICTILSENLLLKQHFEYIFTGKSLNKLYNFLKKIILKETFKNSQQYALKSLMIIIKYGPFYGMHVNFLKSQFDFMTQLALKLPKLPTGFQQETTVETIYEFCKHTARDSRMSCCKLGEQVIPSFLDSYEIKAKEENIKLSLINFFLLQVTIHHPNGAIEDDSIAYAFCWDEWNKCLKGIYSVLLKEINVNLRMSKRNSNIFIKKNSINTLLDSYVGLFVEISRQIFVQNVYFDLTFDCSFPSLAKKQKIETNFFTLIENFQNTKEWLWIVMIYSLVKYYPNTISGKQYLYLLEILSDLQKNCQDPDLRHHLYKALVILENAQKFIDCDNLECTIETLWKGISEAALSPVVLNLNDSQSHKLVQSLIIKRNLINKETIFGGNKLKALNITDYNFLTIKVALHHFSELQAEKEKKIEVLNWILNSSKSKAFSKPLLAELLVYLCLKQWPDLKQTKKKEKFKKFHEIEEIYMGIYLEKFIVTPNVPSENIKLSLQKSFCPDEDILRILLQSLKELTVNSDEEKENCDVDKNLCLSILFMNILCYLSKYSLLNCADIYIEDVFTIFEDHLQRVFHSLKHLKYVNNENIKTVYEQMSLLNLLFKIDENVNLAVRLRKIVDSELINALLKIINTGGKEYTQYMNYNEMLDKLKVLITEVLINFSCIPGTGNLLQTQEYALKKVLEFSLVKENLKSTMVLLKNGLKLCKSGYLSKDILEQVKDLIKDVGEKEYKNYECTVNTVNTLKEFYPLIIENKELFNESVRLLNDFYDVKENYGPELCVALLDTMGRLYELCSLSNFVETTGYLHVSISELLISNYQKVRFAAISQIIKCFTVSTNENIADFQQQQIIFKKIQEMTTKIFETPICENLSEEQVFEENLIRSSCVLQIHSTVIVCSHLWIEEATFSLLRINQKENLTGIDKALEKISKFLKLSRGIEYLEKYLEFLFEKWCLKCDIKSFPCELFQCNKISFYEKYWKTIGCCVLSFDGEVFQEICCHSNKTPKDLVNECIPKIFCHYTLDKILNKSSTLGVVLSKASQINEALLENIEELLFNFISHVIDESDFEKYIGKKMVFPKTHSSQINLQHFEECIKIVEKTCRKDNLLLTLLQSTPKRIFQLLLKINKVVAKSLIIEEKLKYFHYYTIIVKKIFSIITGENEKLLEFFLRHTIYNLLHLIKNENYLYLSKASLEFLREILSFVVSAFPNILKAFIPILTTTLKSVAFKNDEIKEGCIKILKLIVIDHTNDFIEEIKTLENFPNDFEEFNQIFQQIRGPQNNLENEIKSFLNLIESVENMEECEHGLRSLYESLKNKQCELNALYQKINNTRGFSEDIKTSIIHKLICVLIKISCLSLNPNSASIEALRCLGQLGPSDLGSLVLQPERDLVESNWTVWELVSGYMVSLLSKYLVESDVNLVDASSAALSTILKTREALKVTESNSDFGFGIINPSYIYPFLDSCKTASAFKPTIDKSLFLEAITNETLWIPKNNCHETWITKLLVTILDTFMEKDYFAKISAVCQLKVEFCEQMLPLIIYAVLHSFENNTIMKNIFNALDLFFAKHWAITIEKKREDNCIATNKSSVYVILNVVHFIRLQKCHKMNEIQLKLNFLKVAKAAQFCTAQFTAIFYAELWCQEVVEKENLTDSYKVSKLDLIYEKVSKFEKQALHDILRKGYKAVGETDALLGCGISFLLDPKFRVEYYKDLGKWDQVVHYYDKALAYSSSSDFSIPFVNSLNNLGLYKTSQFCSDAINVSDFESLWRLGQWDYRSPPVDLENQKNYEYDRFMALKSIHFGDEINCEKSLENLRRKIVADMFNINLESSHNFYNILTQLKSLKDLEEFLKIQMHPEDVNNLLTDWSTIKVQNDFHYIESIYTQRIVMVYDYWNRNPDNKIKKSLIDFMLNFAEYSRIQGYWHIASENLERLKQIPNLPNEIIYKIQLEDAQICWSNNDKITAKCILRQLSNEHNLDKRLKAFALKLSGKWLVQDRSENRQIIINDYLEKSLELFKELPHTDDGDNKTVVDTYNQLAKFADREYQQINNHIKSDYFQRKMKNMEKSEQSMRDMRSKTLTKEQKMFLTIQLRQNAIDKQEIENIEKEKDIFLQYALKYYLLNLKCSDDNDIVIFRVFSLLLENRNHEMVKNILKKEFIELPSYKFICILPQIMPHISNTNDDFSTAINTIIKKCAIDHPYHTLPLILSLVYANKDRQYNTELKVTIISTNEQRINNAKIILNELKQNEKLKDLIKKMEFLTDALIEFAYYQKGKSSFFKDLNIPTDVKLRKIQNFDNVLVPTYNLNVNKNCKYNIVGIRSFVTKYRLVGGVNEPKRIGCLGTDGIVRMQLLKGKDDLRQDAVMQQVFTIMNNLLGINKQTKNLKIRTYRVVPLSIRSGILEWVDNSMPLGEYLTGNKGAHSIYRPQDWDSATCRNMLKDAAGKSLERKLQVFKEICENFKPVFHKFFEETFPLPTIWYERRRAYIHSVATSSMCGYILGIGDRHVSNILIDKSTAEVIHIDFGIAFEQGQVLPTPETIPFRLTRDIVDGMGVSGVEGVFKRSCEKTVEVLRLNADTIITILEVLLYDPLYQWTISSAEANRRQTEEDVDSMNNLSESSEEDQDINFRAERALLRLRAKLQGTEKDVPISISAQVEALIQEAMDPCNLCRLYNGWQAYL